jgi:large subunit ribosomal protein L24
MQRIKKGDKVRIISGNLFGKEGTVLLVNNKKGVAVVEGLNKRKRHKKASGKQEKGGIVEMEVGIPLSKLALLSPKAPQGISKIKYQMKDGKKIRVSKKTSTPVGEK